MHDSSSSTLPAPAPIHSLRNCGAAQGKGRKLSYDQQLQAWDFLFQDGGVNTSPFMNQNNKRFLK